MTKYRQPKYEHSLPHIDKLVEQLRALVQQSGDPLYWRVALRRVALELEAKHPGEPKTAPAPPQVQRVIEPEKDLE